MQGDNTKRNYSVSLATSKEELETVYRLRYEAYRDPTPEFAGPGPTMFDEYDGKPHCRPYLMRDGQGVPIGSIRPCIYSEAFGFARVPAFDVFEEELLGLIGAKVAFVQSTHFVLSPDHRTFKLLPKLLLIREILRIAIDNHFDYIVSVVRSTESLLNFYQRIGLHRFGPVKMHPQVHREAVLIVAKREEMHRLVSASRIFLPMLPETSVHA